MNHINILLGILFLVCIISVLSGIWFEPFVSIVEAQPSKCFSCEKQLNESNKYLSGPTKCFSCEKELSKLKGSKFAPLAQPSKCFDCEKQFM